MPACYSLSVVKESFSPVLFKIYFYNPLVGILTLYRIALFKGFIKDTGGRPGLLPALIILPIFAAIIFTAAVYLYRRNKDSINDYLSY
jgi:ABC-type polysaccharide/polyol phosphate export permease